jgi:glycyl-tRNA synthetase beta chain
MGKPLLLEIGTEEIPSVMLPALLVQLEGKAAQLLAERRLIHGPIAVYATPRRLALLVRDVNEAQRTIRSEVTGPPKQAAFGPDGKPTAAAAGFAKAQGVEVKDLVIARTAKGEYLQAVRLQPGEKTVRVMPDLFSALIRRLEFPKAMRWSGRFQFVRPIRWLAALYGDRAIRFEFEGFRAGDRTYGHRVMGSRPIRLKGPDRYLAALRRGGVIADPAERRDRIVTQLRAAVKKAKGAPLLDAELLERTVHRTEFPTVVTGRFDERYRALPSEVLTHAMMTQQGYFPVVHPATNALLPMFLCVTNLPAGDLAGVRKGHERVLKARLEDARFYFEKDLKTPLSDLAGGLRGLTFQERLGSMAEKTERLSHLARLLAERFGPETSVVTERAAGLSKADLLTGMVREFPELQGVIGREYAIRQGEPPDVAEPIAEHYRPRYAADGLPKTFSGKLLAIADKLDTIVGFFGLGWVPTGSEDPYALRRQGLGLIRVLLDQRFIEFILSDWVRKSQELYRTSGRLQVSDSELQRSVVQFLRERMDSFFKTLSAEKGWFGDRPVRPDLIQAVLDRAGETPEDAYLRLITLVEFSRDPAFDPLMTAYRRAARILPAGFEGSVSPERFETPVERALHEAVGHAGRSVERALAGRNYREALEALAGLLNPLAAFYDGVMVMAEQEAIRRNRLSLLGEITGLFGRFADFSKIVIEG